MTYRHRLVIDMIHMIEVIDLADRARLPWRFHARRASALLPA